MLPHLILVEPVWIGIPADEFVRGDAINHRRAFDPDLFAVEENRLELLFPQLPCLALRCAAVSFFFGFFTGRGVIRVFRRPERNASPRWPGLFHTLRQVRVRAKS